MLLRSDTRVKGKIENLSFERPIVFKPYCSQVQQANFHKTTMAEIRGKHLCLPVLSEREKSPLFDNMVNRMLEPEMIEDSVKIVNEAIKDNIQVNLIINNRAGGNAPLIAQRIANRLWPEKQQRLL
jgi:hypothetical protein